MNAQSLEDRKNELAFNAELTKKVAARQKEIEGEFVENVLIVESKGGGDKVFIVNKLPKDLLFTADRELIPMGKDQVPTASGKTIDRLLPGIKLSKSGDGGYIFFKNQQEAKQKLDAIDNYIKSKWPSNRPLPQREGYAFQRGNPMSPARPLSMVLRVDLPESPPAEKSAASGQPAQFTPEMLAAIKEQVKTELQAEERAKKSANLAKARAAKAAKKK